MIKKIIFIVIGSFFLTLAVFCTAGYLLFKNVYETTPKAEELLNRSVAQTSIIYDRTGKNVLYEIFSDQNRKILSHDEIPSVVRFTTIAAEDDNFYNHRGFDIASILRAAKINFQAGNARQGASTITQQLARNVFLSREKTWERKIKELIIAVKIEQSFSKDEILDLYLNEISYGSNIYGIEAAAENFFHKKAWELTLDEAAILAALPKAPTFYSPYGNRRNQLAQRQKEILKRVAQLNLISTRKVTLAMKQPIKIYAPQHPIKHPHFVFYVIEKLEEVYGPEYIRKGGLRIITTLDGEIQNLAEDSIRTGVAQNMERYQAENASLVAIEPETGNILAMVGSKDYFAKDIDGQVNVATRPRQPGSAFKPFAYAQAFEKGFQPETKLFDVRTDFGPDGSGKNYIPQNYDGKHRGLVSMREALAMSLNIPAVKTLYLAGIDNTIAFAKKLGISTLNRKNFYGLSLVLGGGEITLLDAVTAYGVFANDGIQAPVESIMKITDRHDQSIEYPFATPRRVIDSEVARKINSVLSDNKARTPVFGPNSSLFLPGHTVAAKTGTTQNYRDAWTVGYTPSIAVGVWAGNNDNRPMRPGAAGIFAAAPIWKGFMEKIIDKYPNEKFISYKKVESNKSILTGKIEGETLYYHKKTGKQLDEDDAKRLNEDEVEIRHGNGKAGSILRHVDKDDPLGPPPLKEDPMLKLWEKGSQNNFEKKEK